MKGSIRNQYSNKGTSLLYVLGALLVVGFIGSAMIKMVTSDKITRAYYSTSSSARSAAKSGMISAINYLQDDEVATLERLQRWIDTPTKEKLFTTYPDDEWVRGSKNSFVTLDNQMAYRTKIVSFDKNTYNIKLVVEGKGNGGARAHMIGMYNLGGIGYNEVTKMVPRNAIQLDGDDNFEMNCSLVVHGNSYFGGKIVTYNKGAVFDGDFHMKKNTSLSYLSRGVTFKKRAYLGGHIKLGSQRSYFYGATGFEQSLKIQNSLGMPVFDAAVGEVYHNGVKMAEYPRASVALPWGKKLNLNGSDLHYRGDGVYNNGAKVSSKFTDITTNQGAGSKKYYEEIGIRAALGIDEVSEIQFDTSVWQSINVYEMSVGEKITAGELNSRYETAVSNGDTLNGKFMVMRAPTTGTGKMFDTHSVPFTGRVVWIMKNQNLNLEKFYESSSTANSVLYVDINNYTPMTDFDYFRGIIYVAGQRLIMKVEDTYIEGSVYHKAGAMHKYNNKGTGGSQLLDITYSDAVINEAALTGIFDAEGSEGSELIIIDKVKGITVGLVSQSM